MIGERNQQITNFNLIQKGYRKKDAYLLHYLGYFVAPETLGIELG